MRPLPPEAATQYGAFATAQALRAGWTPSALRHAARSGTLARLRPGAYALTPDGDTWADRLLAAQQAAVAVSLTNPAVHLSHRSAAALQNLPLVTLPEDVCATFLRGHRGAMPGVHRHRGRMLDGQLAHRGAIRLLSPARTVVDLGCELGAAHAVAAADAALRRGLATRAQLEAQVLACSGWPGVRAARLAVELADPNAESVLESVSRLRMQQAGLRPPGTQGLVYDLLGHFLGRVDFYWEEFGVVGEADGMGKYGERSLSLVTEKKRQGLLEDTGLIVERWGWAELRPFDPTAARLRRAFARGLTGDRPRRWRIVPTDATWPQTSAVS